MRGTPRVQYARNGDVNLAYTVIGDGPVDLVFVTGWFSHQEMFWETPASRAFFSELADRFRLISYDKRGTGMSDPLDDAGAYTDRIDDLRVVMDAAGAEQPVVCGLSEGGMLSAIFAATEPERVRSLVLLSMPLTAEMLLDVESARNQLRDGWGEGALYELFLPEIPDTPESRALWARTQRQSASRGLALQYFDQITQLDARPVLPAVSVPTLVLRGRYDLVATHDHAVATADAIPGATLKEVDCGHIPWLTGGAQVVSAITEFVTGAPAPVPAQRRLATVLFTDIVDSTARATSLGDRAWRSLLDRHDDAVRAELDRFSGREVKATGDGSSPPSRGPRRRSTAPCRPERSSRSWASRPAPASTLGSARSAARTSAASPCTSAPAWRRWRDQGRCWSPGRCAISSPGPTFASRIAASTCSRACRSPGGSTPSADVRK